MTVKENTSDSPFSHSSLAYLSHRSKIIVHGGDLLTGANHLGFGVTQGHQKRHYSIEHIQLYICLA